MIRTLLPRRGLLLGAAALTGCAWQPQPVRFNGFGSIAELTGLSLTPGGEALAFSTLAGDITMFDSATLRPRSNKRPREGESLLAFALSHDSLVVVMSTAVPSASKTRGHDRRSKVIVDDLASGQGGDVLTIDGRVSTMRVARAGKHAIFATEPSDVSVVDLGTATTVARWSSVKPTDIAISARGEQIAWATPAGISLGSPSSPELRLVETKTPASAIQFAERGRALYAVAGEELLRFDLESLQKEAFPLPGSASAFAAASDGSVAIANDDGFALLEGSARRNAPVAAAGDPPRFVAYDAAGRRAFVASRASVTVYDTAKMSAIGVLRDTLSDVPRVNG